MIVTLLFFSPSPPSPWRRPAAAPGLYLSSPSVQASAANTHTQTQGKTANHPPAAAGTQDVTTDNKAT